MCVNDGVDDIRDVGVGRVFAEEAAATEVDAEEGGQAAEDSVLMRVAGLLRRPRRDGPEVTPVTLEPKTSAADSGLEARFAFARACVKHQR